MIRIGLAAFFLHLAIFLGIAGAVEVEIIDEATGKQYDAGQVLLREADGPPTSMTKDKATGYYLCDLKDATKHIVVEFDAPAATDGGSSRVKRTFQQPIQKRIQIKARSPHTVSLPPAQEYEYTVAWYFDPCCCQYRPVWLRRPIQGQHFHVRSPGQ